MPYSLYPLYLRLQEQQPRNNGSLPEPVPMPPPNEGPHFEYLVQWLLFAATALIIWGGLVRREIARRRADAGEPDQREPVAV
jgi:cytochrome oxidase assembly protein ShyY1